MASQSTLFLRNMPTDIVREAKATAARRGTTLARVVADALTKSRDVAPDALREELALERGHPAGAARRHARLASRRSFSHGRLLPIVRVRLCRASILARPYLDY